MPALDPAVLRQLFLDARTHNGWLDGAVSDETLQELWALARMGPTAANLAPGRLVFVKSAAAKEKLKPALAPGNVEKTMKAPVTAIVAFDTSFHEHAPVLAPQRDWKATVASMPAEAREAMAAMNGTLQGAYVILAARALGLDCGPMGGFDKAKVDAAFFAGTTWRSNFLLNLGHGDPTALYPRQARLTFEQAARIE